MSVDPFSLHPLLVRDALPLVRLSLCQVLLASDARYPWLILVPERPGLRDFDEVAAGDVPLLHADIALACAVLRRLFQPDKLNVASLGNLVPQLHIHVIARFQSDAAWPGPIWGRHSPLPYAAGVLEERVGVLREAFLHSSKYNLP
ncbi:MAG: HIT family protein [Magnetococcales bacterium]|nr:HIT family protein [Magnetococcales bacterium]